MYILYYSLGINFKILDLQIFRFETFELECFPYIVLQIGNGYGWRVGTMLRPSWVCGNILYLFTKVNEDQSKIGP